MTQTFTLTLTPAKLYYLRELVLAHADDRQQDWSVLKQILNEHWIAFAQHENTYGAFSQRDFLDFKKHQAFEG
jgi:hypothetical protein